jgi:tRNA (cmo5U34)-methyltransferase
MQIDTTILKHHAERLDSTMTRDSLYQQPKSPLPPFEFDDQVARVFDDMIHRSIPFYTEIISRQIDMIEHFYQPGTVIYDLGCSNGNLGISLSRQLHPRPFQMVAVDNSAPMLKAFQERLTDLPMGQHISLQCEDICRTRIENASVVVLNFTLQFVAPPARDAMLARIYNGLRPGGVLLFCEKITHSHPALAELQHTFYYAFKRKNGYSDLEISQKREALEKVLIPESLDRHLQRLEQSGFEIMDVWHKWYNFASLIAIK